MNNALTEIIDALRHRNGPAIPSICSAHEHVIAAGLRQAAAHDMPALIEATSNQVNQFGGYTGMQPADFVTFVREIASSIDMEHVPLILGGDHLGPQAWRDKPVDEAMKNAAAMVRAYAAAGFTKIHLDCSEGCAGEPPQIGDAEAAARAAALAVEAEKAAPDPSKMSYVIGTEVPPPGGARHDDEGIKPTPPERAAATIEAHRQAFEAAGIGSAWDRVCGLVVQPGLEFAPASIHHFDTAQPDLLSAVLGEHPALCFEAHSTDYQRDEVYPALAGRNFGILKVGPALTFAWREALYALSHVRHWLDGSPHISDVLETLMLNSPKHWQGHYRGADLRLLRHFGYADRIRYYWPAAKSEVHDLCASINGADIPEPILRQYLPQLTLLRAQTLDLPRAESILQAHVEAALIPYYGRSSC